jgi:hypothetical protein
MVQNYRNSGACEEHGESTASARYNQHWYERQLEQGGYNQYRFDLFEYLVLNVGIAAVTFVSVFGLAFLIPMLIRGLAFVARRYWKWLNA